MDEAAVTVVRSPTGSTTDGELTGHPNLPPNRYHFGSKLAPNRPQESARQALGSSALKALDEEAVLAAHLAPSRSVFESKSAANQFQETARQAPGSSGLKPLDQKAVFWHFCFRFCMHHEFFTATCELY